MPTNSVKLLPGGVPLQRVATLLQLQHICRPSVFTVTNTTAVQICLLVEWCCKMDACWVFAIQSCMLAGVVLPSLSAIPVGMVSHYQPCYAGVVPHYRPYLLMWCLNISPAVLVWCLSIGYAFWCGASLQAMASGVVPHYQPCLLVCCLTIGRTFWCGASILTLLCWCGAAV